jgi:pyruvate,water dikinase
VREDALADVGLAWPQLRRMLREMGRRLVASEVVDRPDDVFWLRRAEVLGQPPAPLAVVVEERRALWRGQRRVTPPQVLPRGGWWEKSVSRWLPATTVEQTGAVLRGTGASAGQVTATARVLAAPADFRRMQPGDVLVASITTPAWTSLFAMAGAVVTDIGGPLSHSSIVAREYGIPAVLGTAVATRRIPDGARVRVDGDAGTVTLLDEPDGQDDAGSSNASTGSPAKIMSRIRSVTSQMLTFIPARTRPSRTQNATNSRASTSPRTTTSSSASARPTYSMPRSYWSVKK